MTLHLSHIFFTDARTFITNLVQLFIAICDSAAVEIVWRKLNEYPVARQNANKMLAHLSRYVRKDLMLAFFQFNPKHSVRQSLQDFCHDFYSLFLRHILSG